MKTVSWTVETQDPIVKRNCECEGCPHCKAKINVHNMYCNTFGEHKCTECKCYRCSGCLYSKTHCNYCKRLL